ncbi:MAG: hypothetical protein N4A50_07765 [Vallitalea sp.]|nr:hypothetical protein [Vallitalea sp.]
MRNTLNKLSSVIVICLLVINMPLGLVLAEERNIYIGDMVTIEINSAIINEEEVVIALEEFEIVELEETNKGYLVTIRSFDIGEKKVIIGNQEINITISSTLEDINRDDIYEGDLNVKSYGSNIPWLYIYIFVLVICIVSGVILLIRKIRTPKHKQPTAYESFISSLELISNEADTYLVDSTILLKKYIEEVFNCIIKGKTSSEIMTELQSIDETSQYRTDIYNWLIECDTYKFSKDKISNEEKVQLRLSLIKIVSLMNETVDNYNKKEEEV